jgi:hypothetical protein
LFWQGRPVFIDALSLERRPNSSSLWPAADQFIRLFVLPLLAYRSFGHSPRNSFAVDRSGPTPKELYPLYSFLGRLSPTVGRYVTLPSWLEGARQGSGLYTEANIGSDEKAAFVFGHLLKRFERTLNKLAPDDDRKSTWSEYADDNSYTDETRDRKKAFINAAAGDLTGRMALDVGMQPDRRDQPI